MAFQSVDYTRTDEQALSTVPPYYPEFEDAAFEAAAGCGEPKDPFLPTAAFETSGGSGELKKPSPKTVEFDHDIQAI